MSLKLRAKVLREAWRQHGTFIDRYDHELSGRKYPARAAFPLRTAHCARLR